MAVVQMCRFNVCALKKDRKAILEEIQSFGILQVDTSRIKNEKLKLLNTVEQRQTFEREINDIENALSIILKFSPEKKSLLSSLEGKTEIDEKTMSAVIRNRESLSSAADSIIRLNKEINENEAKVIRLETSKESLTPWLSIGYPLSYRGTEKTSVFIGMIPKGRELSEIIAEVSSKAETDAFDIEVVSDDKNVYYVAVTCLKENTEKIESAIKSLGFAPPVYVTRHIPSERKVKIEKEVADTEEYIESLKQKIVSYKDKLASLRQLADYYRMRADKYEVLGDIPQSAKTFVVSGYVPCDKAEALKNRIASEYICEASVEDIPEDEEIPILLKNGRISSSAEGVLESFGLPKRHEIDPTGIMSVFYIVLFGMMLSDAAYGFLMALLCFLAIIKFPRMEKGLSKTLHLFMYCGISTLVWGILFGGYFGDGFDVIARVFFGRVSTEPLIPAVWFVPINDPMKLLLFSLGFGLVHLFFGLGLKGYQYLKNKNYAGFVCEVLFWYMVLIGLILIFVTTPIFTSIAGTAVVLPEAVIKASKIVALVGAVGLLFFAARDKKNFLLRIALGAYEIYGISGWLSDVLSYSRLLALGLATGVIASVVNQMGSMFGTGTGGKIGFAVVFVIGHLLNLAINLLGAYVHTNRLQYVEFFGKFYEGGGEAFKPFRQNTKYVDIKKEK